MNLNLYSNCAQVIIAFSVTYVWIFRFNVIVNEFREYGIPDVLRSAVGASKVSLATLLVVGIWYPSVVLGSSLLMAFLMFCAQIAHFRVKHPLRKYLPSLALLLLSLFVAGVRLEVLPR